MSQVNIARQDRPIYIMTSRRLQDEPNTANHDQHGPTRTNHDMSGPIMTCLDQS